MRLSEDIAVEIDRKWREKGGLNCTEVCAIVMSVSDRYSQYWEEGTRIIENCLEKSRKGDPLNAPFPLVGDEAALWQKAQMEAYQHALEMMGVPNAR